MATKKIKSVNVTFQRGGSQYEYLLPSGMKAEVGDIAVVNSPRDGIVKTDIVGLNTNAKHGTKAVEGIISCKLVRELQARAEEEKRARQRLDVLLEQRVRDNKYAILADDAEARELMSKLGVPHK